LLLLSTSENHMVHHLNLLVELRHQSPLQVDMSKPAA
jgi:hypothetical protein